MNIREIEDRIKTRPLKHVEPLKNFVELMKLDVDETKGSIPTPKTKKKLVRKKITNINNLTIDKSMYIS